METFSALLALCAGNSLVTGEFPSQRPVTQSFHVFFDLRVRLVIWDAIVPIMTSLLWIPNTIEEVQWVVRGHGH